MRNIIYIFILFVVSAPNLSADSYIATRQELLFSDSSYYKTSHHIKVGKSVILDNYRLFGEVGFGEDINEGTPIGSGASYHYLRFDINKIFFNSLKLNVNYRSKMKSVGRDLNWIVINTKYTF